MKIQTNRFSIIAIIIMSVIFIMNLILSREDNLLWIILTGGGGIVDYLGESYITIFEDFQLYRLITYGYTQTAIWHLLINILALWYVGLYLEKKIGIIKFMFVYHSGLVVAGIIMLIIFPNSFNYGASPAIFACLGMLVNWLIGKRTLLHEYKSQKGFYFLLNYLILSNLFGIGTLVIHLLGFAMGFLLGFVVKEKELM